MDWKDIAESVADAAPLIGGVLAGPAGAAAGTLLASIFGTDGTPEAVAAAIKSDPEAAVKLREAELAHAEAMRRLYLEAKASEQAAITQRLTAINKTMRAELETDGWFKSGWRPAIGWAMAFSIISIVVGLGSVLMNDPSKVRAVVDGIIALLAVMGPVLGVNIHARSRETQTKLTGRSPDSLLSAIIGKK